MKNKWKQTKTEKKFNDNVFDIEHRTYWYERAGASMPFSVLNMADWVVIIPVTKEGRFVLVNQFRVGPDGYTLEFPGGAVEKGEPHELAAPRELEEETGYRAEELKLLTTMNPNPAFMTNKCHVYLATGCSPTGEMNTDLFEDVEPVELPKIELQEKISSGEIIHSIALAAWGVYSSFSE